MNRYVAFSRTHAETILKALVHTMALSVGLRFGKQQE